MSPATGPISAPMCAPAAGRSSITTRIIPISTIPRLSSWRWTAPRACAAARTAEAVARAREWVEGLQSKDGGWGAFDADNDKLYLNNLPFADHGALLDPPTADVGARCVSMLAQLGEPLNSPRMQAALAWLEREQEPEGSWFGRWGVNYIYGTWSVLCALGAGRDRPRASDDCQGGELAEAGPESRRRLGRELRFLCARPQGPRARAIDRLANCLGGARADGRGRSRRTRG